MSKPEQDWHDEQSRINFVVSEITKRISTLEEQVSVTRADIVDIRKNFWDDVTVNFDDPNEAVETYASLKQQAEVLSERERSHRHSKNQLTTLNRLKSSPYFGRIDFFEDGMNGTEQVYLGIASFLDESEENFLIYDWRAPVASMYYDYPPGPAQYQTPGGVITGEMELKRQFIIRDRIMRSMFDTGITIGDELLQEVLGNQADTQMKSIVATIQKEQNRIIRNERSRLLVVQGAAGSGKTSSALQRVAYLLYRYRETLRADHIVLFSPNPLFNSYVSTVLPELGEENMQQTTFQEYLERRLGRTFQLEDPFAQLEYVHTANTEPGYHARIAGITYKASSAFMKAIELYLQQLGLSGLQFKDITFRGRTLISAEQIHSEFYSHDTSLSIPNRMEFVVKWLLGELKERARLERKKQWVEDEIQLLDQDAYYAAYQELRKKKRLDGDTFDDFDQEQKFLSKMVVGEHFKPLRANVKRLTFIDMVAVYKQLFSQPEFLSAIDSTNELLQSSDWASICKETVEKIDRSELAYEDATPYLYLKERIEGFQTNNTVRHVFIDEAQDYSPFQFAFLKKLFPNCKMTVLGDLNQAIYAHSDARTDYYTHITSLYEADQTEVIELTQSYRSTKQIVEFTRGLLPGGARIEPFNRDGKIPTLTQAQNQSDLAAKIAERIKALQQAGNRTIAVICKTSKESKLAYASLQELVPLRLIGKETISFEPGTVVIPSYLAKGVEFDAVIIYNAGENEYGAEIDRKLFYTACTRAMHELHVYYMEEVSPFISLLQSNTYSQEK